MAKIADPVLDPIRPTDPPEPVADPRHAKARRIANRFVGNVPPGQQSSDEGRPRPPGMALHVEPKRPNPPRRSVPPGQTEPKLLGPGRRSRARNSYKTLDPGAGTGTGTGSEPLPGSSLTKPVQYGAPGSGGNYKSNASPNVSQRSGLTQYSNPVHPSSSRRRGL